MKENEEEKCRMGAVGNALIRIIFATMNILGGPTRGVPI